MFFISLLVCDRIYLLCLSVGGIYMFMYGGHMFMMGRHVFLWSGYVLRLTRHVTYTILPYIPIFTFGMLLPFINDIYISFQSFILFLYSHYILTATHFTQYTYTYIGSIQL